MACPIIVECCPGYTPRSTYYVTFTNAGVGCPACGCDCIGSVVVPVTLFETGDYTTNPNCPGCKTAESWKVWRGDATVAGCFSPYTGASGLRFCAQLVCDPAGAGTVCGSFGLYADVRCGNPTAPACDFGVITALGPPDSCTCSPFDLVWSTPIPLGNEIDGDCCRDTAGDNINGLWTIEVTE